MTLSSGALNAERFSEIVVIVRIFLNGWVSFCRKQRRDYAWSFFPNHAYFLFRTGEGPLATLMRRLLTGHVVSFNRRHKRHGHLLQNRYKSIGCQEETYLQELVRYIHMNPLRAGVVPDLAALSRYPYCGHSALMGKRKRPWQNVDYVLHSFGKRVGRARRGYFSYVEAGVEQGREGTEGGDVREESAWRRIKDTSYCGHAEISQRVREKRI